MPIPAVAVAGASAAANLLAGLFGGGDKKKLEQRDQLLKERIAGAELAYTAEDRETQRRGDTNLAAPRKGLMNLLAARLGISPEALAASSGVFAQGEGGVAGPPAPPVAPPLPEMAPTTPVQDQQQRGAAVQNLAPGMLTPQGTARFGNSGQAGPTGLDPERLKALLARKFLSGSYGGGGT